MIAESRVTAFWMKWIASFTSPSRVRASRFAADSGTSSVARVVFRSSAA